MCHFVEDISTNVSYTFMNCLAGKNRGMAQGMAKLISCFFFQLNIVLFDRKLILAYRGGFFFYRFRFRKKHETKSSTLECKDLGGKCMV